MENYIDNYDSYNTKVIYDFKLGDGGIGDNIKFFMFILGKCIKEKKRLYYKKNNIVIEKYIKLKYEKMYWTKDLSDLPCSSEYQIVTPYMFYSSINYNFDIEISKVFYFTDDVINNSKYLFPLYNTNYISIHLRLGDMYLETDTHFIHCKEDARSFSEEKLYTFITQNKNDTIFFCCDNNDFKMKLKEKFNNIFVTNCHIGHSSLSNTTEKQILDALSEFYLLANSKVIFGASNSGFSKVASKFYSDIIFID